MALEDLNDDDPDIRLFGVMRDDGSADPATDPHVPEATVARAYREMKRLRLLDARMILLQRQGRIGFYGAAQGQEAVPIATGLAVHADDDASPAEAVDAHDAPSRQARAQVRHEALARAASATAVDDRGAVG